MLRVVAAPKASIEEELTLVGACKLYTDTLILKKQKKISLTSLILSLEKLEIFYTKHSHNFELALVKYEQAACYLETARNDRFMLAQECLGQSDRLLARLDNQVVVSSDEIMQMQIKVCLLLGICYKEQGNFLAAVIEFNKNIDNILILLKDTKNRALPLVAVNGLYLSLLKSYIYAADCYFKLNDTHNFKLCLARAEQLSAYHKLTSLPVLALYGVCLCHQYDWSKALQILQMIVDNKTVSSSDYLIENAKIYLAICLIKLKQFPQAQRVLCTSIAFFKVHSDKFHEALCTWLLEVVEKNAASKALKEYLAMQIGNMKLVNDDLIQLADALHEISSDLLVVTPSPKSATGATAAYPVIESKDQPEVKSSVVGSNFSPGFKYATVVVSEATHGAAADPGSKEKTISGDCKKH